MSREKASAAIAPPKELPKVTPAEQTDIERTPPGAAELGRGVGRSERQRRLYETILSNTPDLVYVFDLNYRFSFVNQALLQMWGRTLEDSLGKSLLEIGYEPWHAAMHEREIDQVIKTKQPIRGEVAFPHATLGRRIYDYIFVPVIGAAGEVEAIAGTTRDVTERKQIEDELRTNQIQLTADIAANRVLQRISTELIREQGTDELYRKIVEAAAVLMSSDCASMQMLHPERSKGGELHLIASHGFTPHAMQFWEWVRTDSECTCGVALGTGGRVVVSDVETCDFLAGSDDLAAYREAGIRAVQSTPLVSRSGRLLGMISTHWRQPYDAPESDLQRLDVLARQAADLIERTSAEAALRAREEQLREADRRKDEFLAMLAHELRNPLAPISNAGELLSRIIPEDSRGKFAIEMIKRQTSQLTHLVDDLLDVARITQGRIELQRRPIDLASVITHAVESVEPQLREKEHRLSTIAESYEPLYVNGDRVRLVQCVTNVLTNAIKYTDHGGEIRVVSRAAGEIAVIDITDSGTGITAELLPKVFDLFVQSERTLDRAQGGLGIGLAIVKRLVEMHGGEVRVHSAGLGHGSTFEIHLPRVARPQSADAEASGNTITPRRIFIVDDNQDAADSLAALLSLQGHETHVAFSASHALERIESLRPEVVLLDLGLPEMNGYLLAEKLRTMPQLQGIRLIALTGYGQAEDRQRTQASGFDDHLIKPVDLSALERALADLPARQAGPALMAD